MEENENFIQNKYGYCFYCLEDNNPAIIFNLYINPKYRQQGHARHLIQLVKKEIRHSGYKGDIQIQAQPQDNSIAIDKLIGFYKDMSLKITVQDESIFKAMHRV